MIDAGFWRSRHVLVTGHSGFKGSWPALWLRSLGAEVHGLACRPSTTPPRFAVTGLDKHIEAFGR